MYKTPKARKRTRVDREIMKSTGKQLEGAPTRLFISYQARTTNGVRLPTRESAGLNNMFVWPVICVVGITAICIRSPLPSGRFNLFEVMTDLATESGGFWNTSRSYHACLILSQSE